MSLRGSSLNLIFANVISKPYIWQFLSMSSLHSSPSLLLVTLEMPLKSCSQVVFFKPRNEVERSWLTCSISVSLNFLFRFFVSKDLFESFLTHWGESLSRWIRMPRLQRWCFKSWLNLILFRKLLQLKQPDNIVLLFFVVVWSSPERFVLNFSDWLIQMMIS